MKFGRFELSTHNLGFFRLDGGAMFGSVPKNLWSKRIPADEENCIKLATRSLIIRDDKRSFLVDVGMGDKWNEKQRQIFAVNNFPVSDWGFKKEEITDVILTHMHFDHGGGISEWKDQAAGTIRPSYPKATHYIQTSNLETARHPNLREKASYLKENVGALDLVKTVLTNRVQEIYPDIWVHEVNGHTHGQQWVEVKDGNRSVVFATDLVPTSHHLPVPYNMGYDLWTEKLYEEKEAFLSMVMKTNSIIVFQHDPEVAAATITKDTRDHYCIKDIEDF
ncbi:MAG: MBL fold metallo-hydrolase [bacterium]|nr:MBL fold metallo-hydrolase [bacterium]